MLADAFEIAQPDPTKLTSCTAPSSTRMKTFNWSPHSGLNPSATRFAPSSSLKLRGFLLWSRMTCWYSSLSSDICKTVNREP